MKRLLLILLLLGAAGGGAYYWYAVREQPAAEATAASGTPARGGGSRRRGAADGTPIPVLTARSEQRDVPVWLDGLGTVQAFNQVQVRPFVDGPLVEVRFQEGQSVKTGDVLARIDPRPYQASLDAATAKKQQDEANLANARADVGRYAKLTAGAYASAQQYDTARATVAQLTAQVAGDQGAVDSARTQLSYATITAPIDGRTGLRQVDQGNIVHPADTTPITVITQLKPISVVFTLPQQMLPQVAAAMAGGMPPVLAVPPGAPPGSPALDQGQLAVLDNQVDPTTGTIKLKATFPNPGLKLWPGAFVNVRLLASTDQDATTVPTAAVQRGPDGAYLYAVGADDKAVRRPLKLGHADELVTVVANGVEAGERVVTDGAQRLTEGQKVAIAAPDGNVAADAVAARGPRAPGARRGS